MPLLKKNISKRFTWPIIGITSEGKKVKLFPEPILKVEVIKLEKDNEDTYDYIKRFAQESNDKYIFLQPVFKDIIDGFRAVPYAIYTKWDVSPVVLKYNKQKNKV